MDRGPTQTPGARAKTQHLWRELERLFTEHFQREFEEEELARREIEKRAMDEWLERWLEGWLKELLEEEEEFLRRGIEQQATQAAEEEEALEEEEVEEEEEEEHIWGFAEVEEQAEGSMWRPLMTIREGIG